VQDELQTSNRKLHTAISIQKKKVVFVRLELSTFTLQHHSPDYLFTAGKYIHEATL